MHFRNLLLDPVKWRCYSCPELVLPGSNCPFHAIGLDGVPKLHCRACGRFRLPTLFARHHVVGQRRACAECHAARIMNSTSRLLKRVCIRYLPIFFLRITKHMFLQMQIEKGVGIIPIVQMVYCGCSIHER